MPFGFTPDPLLDCPRRELPRSLIVFAAIGAGLVIGRAGEGTSSALWFGLACAFAAAAIPLRRRACAAAMIAAAVMLGAGWFQYRLREPGPDSLVRLLAGRELAPAILTIEGIVLDEPRTVERERPPLTPIGASATGTRLRIDVRAVESEHGTARATGKVWVSVPGALADPPRAGELVRISGHATPIAPPLNPGERDRRLWGAQEGYAGTVRVPHAGLVQRLGTPSGALDGARSRLLAWRAGLSARARTLLLGGVGPCWARALLGALILGEDDPALTDVRSAFTRLGLAHVLAISGFHLAVMAGVALVLVRITGDRGFIEPLIVSCLVALYLAILPVNAPVWRSGLMVLALLAADALGRRYDRLALLGWIAIALILWRPMDLWSIGFQLSFGLVGLLIWLGDYAHGRVFRAPLLAPPARTWAGTLLEPCKRLVTANLLCCAVAAPLVAYHTGLLSPLAVLTGVIVVPPIVLLLVAAYCVLMLGMLVPAAATAAGDALGWLAGANVWLVTHLDAIPGASLSVPRVSMAWAVCATGLALYWFALGHLRDRAAWSATAILGAWLGAELALGPGLPRATRLRIDTLAVGDGTCHLVRSGRDALLWDCGSLTPGQLAWMVPRAVRELGAGAVRTAVVSHPNLDHYNGLLDAAGPLGIQTVLVGETFLEQAAHNPNGGEAFVLDGCRRRGIDVRQIAAGDTLALGSTTIRFLSPPAGVAWQELNNRSLVASIASPGSPAPVLLTGDIQEQAIEGVLRAEPRPKYAVMEAPHHGSIREAAARFIMLADPGVVVQSTGRSRAADQRWAPVRRGRRWYTTATDGAAWVELRADGTVRSGALRR